MKKIYFVVMILSLTVSLTACGNTNMVGFPDSAPEQLTVTNGTTDKMALSLDLQDQEVIPNPDIENQEITEQISDTAIVQEVAFDTLIANNPIDRSYNPSDEAGSEIRIREAVAYRDAWNAEIAYAMEILKEHLTAEDYDTLTQARTSWDEYMEATMCVEQNIFYPGMFYGIGSNDTYPLVMETVAARTRDYAIELMALEYAFTGTVKFAAGN